MFRNLFVAALLFVGLGLTVSSCAPGVYAGTSVGVGVGPGYYGPNYYGYGPGYYGGPRYYGAPVIVNPRPIIVNPRPRFYGGGGYRSDAGFRGGYRGNSVGGSFHGGGFGGGGGRRGGR